MNRKRLVCLTLISLFSLASCSKEASFVERDFSVSTDSWAIKLYDGTSDDLDALQSKVERAYKIADANIFYADINNVFTINTAKNQAITVDDDLKALVMGAISRSSKTSGYFDPLIGGLVSLWQMKLSSGTIPTKDEISKALDEKKNTSLSIASNTITLSGDGLLDLGAITKGYALEVCKTYLKSKGIKEYLIDAGGFDKMYGENPNASDGKFSLSLDVFGGKSISIKNASVLTYSNYEDEVEVDGKTYASIINPKTGENEFVSPVAMAIGDDAMGLEALSMVGSMLGAEGAKSFETSSGTDNVSFILGDKGSISYSSSTIEIH